MLKGSLGQSVQQRPSTPDSADVKLSILLPCLRQAGADPGFFLGRGALISCSTSTPINHIVFCFCRIPVVLESRRSSQERGVCAPPAPSP